MASAAGTIYFQGGPTWLLSFLGSARPLEAFALTLPPADTVVVWECVLEPDVASILFATGVHLVTGRVSFVRSCSTQAQILAIVELEKSTSFLLPFRTYLFSILQI